MSLIQGKISIITPLYNKVNHIANTLNSVIEAASLYDNIECIIIDDESNDGSSEIAIEFEKKYPNIFTYLRINHRGIKNPSNARNIGIRYSTGEYIKFLDADDMILKDTLRNQAQFLSDNPHIDLYGQENHINKNDRLSIVNNISTFDDLYGNTNMDLHFSSFIYRNKFVKELPLFQNVYAEDVIFLYNYAYHHQNIFVDLTCDSFIYNLERNELSEYARGDYNGCRSKSFPTMITIEALNKINNNTFPFYIEWIQHDGLDFWVVCSRLTNQRLASLDFNKILDNN